MIKKCFVFVHGLPGAGKSTLCRETASRFSDIHYVNLAQHPEFGVKSMPDICVEMVLGLDDAKIILTEGVFSKAGSRDRFMETVISALSFRAQRYSDVTGVVVFLDEATENLAKRRNRSREDYQALRNEVETGSRKFKHVTLHSEDDDIPRRVTKFYELLSEICKLNDF